MTSNPHQTASAYHYDISTAGIGATRRSASIIVPMLMDLVKPSSVVDVGCGLADWLAEFKRAGCVRILGMDGDWVPREHLQISTEEFQSRDLGERLPSVGRFDLATSFEVAEHIHEAAGKDLVRFLTETADVVAFSAAVPKQGGYEHINERWQSYWVAEFAARGFAAYDVIRPAIWSDAKVCWWYRQNLLLFANDEAAKKMGLNRVPFLADVVHPCLYEWHSNSKNWSGSVMMRMLKEKIMRKLGMRQERAG
jgi:SAM-dependent methyltransferase